MRRWRRSAPPGAAIFGEKSPEADIVSTPWPSDHRAITPTVSYQFTTEEGYTEIAKKAKEYCEDEHDSDAMLIERKAQDGYTEATFACK